MQNVDGDVVGHRAEFARNRIDLTSTRSHPAGAI
jgi:hypothetical protein